MGTAMNEKAILLINLGTPSSTKVKDVRRYLREFLSDGRVIDIPAIPRFLLVNGIIAPFRAPKSAKEYRKIWTDKGSPIISYGYELTEEVQKKTTHSVYLAMRYGTPSLKAVLNELYEKSFSEIVVVPLYPQYASSTVGSILEIVSKEIATWDVFPKITFINQFYNHKGYIDAFVENIKKLNYKDFDHILFSYHGLPNRHVERTHHDNSCEDMGCHIRINEDNKSCYRAQCYETTKLIAETLKLDASAYTTCFQSRFSKNWLEPFTDHVIEQKAKDGAKNLLVVSPAFVADCLETIAEIGIGYKELFIEQGGDDLSLVPSLNANNKWVDALLEIVMSKS